MSSPLTVATDIITRSINAVSNLVAPGTPGLVRSRSCRFTLPQSQTSVASTPTISCRHRICPIDREPVAFDSSILKVVEGETVQEVEREASEEPNSFSPKISPQRGIKRKSSRLRSTHGINQRANKRTLVTGYIRQEIQSQDGLSTDWPRDLSNVVLEWYDETSYWLIRGREMDSFKSLRNGQTMYGPKFQVGRLCEFDTTICPNGWKANQKGSCQFYIELHSMDSEKVKSITVYYELSCKNTHSVCKKIRTFRKKSDAQSWGTNNMRFTECESLDSLEMATMVKVLRVEYTKTYKQQLAELELESDPDSESNHSNPNQIERPIFECERIVLHREMSFSWRIGRDLMDKFTSCAEGKFFYSQNFGGSTGSFCFEIAPNGWHQTNRGQSMLYLRLLGLPQRVKSIRCRCEFEGILHEEETDGIHDDTVSRVANGSLEHTFSYSKHGVQWHLQDMVSIETLQSLKEMEVGVRVTIIGVVDVEGNKIETAQWSQYDIVSSEN